VRGVAFAAFVIAACTPDTSHTAFRCDDSHGCPSGQTCVGGRCHRGPVTGDGVVCDTQKVCAPDQQCCLDLFNPPRCIAAGDECPGTSAFCDGVEDCQMGDRCCAESTVSCGSSCGIVACRDGSDCPTTEPNCCDHDGPRWGTCSPFQC